MLTICPSCLSIEGGEFCSECGTSLTVSDAAPLFYLKIGWSRSREFEKILNLLKEEDGYEYIENGEEIAYRIPINNFESARVLLSKYEKTLKWKETTFQLQSGESFSPLSGVPLCFMRLILEGSSPCQKQEECPYSNLPLQSFLYEKINYEDFLVGDYEDFSKDYEEEENEDDVHPDDLFADEDDTDDSDENSELKVIEINRKALTRLYLTDLIHNRELLLCPFYRTLVTLATTKLISDPESLWSYYSRDVESALEKGFLIMDGDGNYLPMKELTDDIVYDTANPGYISHKVKWGAMNGTFQVVSDGISIYQMPGKEFLAPWPSASSILETTEGRYVIMPPHNFHDAHEFLLVDEMNESFKLGQFPSPWAFDSNLKNFAFARKNEFNDQIIIKGYCLWKSETPVFIIEDEFELDGEITSLQICGENTAAVIENNFLSLYYGKDLHSYEMRDISSVKFLGKSQLVVLWGGGRRVSVIENGDRYDYYLLLPALDIHSTVSGNIIIVFDNRIIEVSPKGAILDYRHEPNSTYYVTSQGYLEKIDKETTWHFLDRTVIDDEFPDEEPEGIMLLKIPPAENEPTDYDKELLVSLLYYLNKYHETEMFRDEIRRLWKEAPRKVKKELTAMEKSFGWIQKFRKNKKIPWQVNTSFLKQ